MIRIAAFELSASAMPINIHVKGADIKPLQVTLSQKAMWIHLMDRDSTQFTQFPQMIQEDDSDDVDDRVQDPRFATHDWGEVNVVVNPTATADSPKSPEKDDKDKEKESDSEPPSPSEHHRSGDHDDEPEVCDKHTDGGAGGGGGDSGRGSAEAAGGNAIRGDGNAARLGLPDMINPFGPDGQPLKTVAHRYGRCECGRICDWRFRLVNHRLHSGDDLELPFLPANADDDSADSADETENEKMISDGEEISRSARRKRIGCHSDVYLLEKRQR